MKKILLSAFVSLFAMQAHAATQDLINSVKNGDLPRVIELLNNGENVNGTDERGATALHYAVLRDNADMTKVLLSHGADVSATSNKGWTPLKIAERQNLENVTPVLVEYLSLQKQVPLNNAVVTVEEKAVEIKPIPVEVGAAAVEKSDGVIEAVKAEVVRTEAEVVEEAKADNDNNYQEMLNEATQAVIDARSAQTKAEAESKILADELKKVKEEKAELEAKLAEKNKVAAQPVAKPAEVKKAVVTAKPAVAKPATPKTTVAKASPTPAKPVARAPQPIVKKVVIKPSTMVDGIYAGDEEIVYCLDYLGNGENENLKRAAGHYAASASISEPRYKQIVDKAESYYTKASEAEIAKRDIECSKIITPKNDTDKQNQIIRSINKSVGY